jgi:hypothetical protein
LDFLEVRIGSEVEVGGSNPSLPISIKSMHGVMMPDIATVPVSNFSVLSNPHIKWIRYFCLFTRTTKPVSKEMN